MMSVLFIINCYRDAISPSSSSSDSNSSSRFTEGIVSNGMKLLLEWKKNKHEYIFFYDICEAITKTFPILKTLLQDKNDKIYFLTKILDLTLIGYMYCDNSKSDNNNIELSLEKSDPLS